MSTNANGSGHCCPANRPHLQEYVTLIPLWTASGLVVSDSPAVVWLCLPVAVVVATLALRAGYRRLPTAISAAVAFLHMLVVRDGVKLAALTLLAAYFLGHEAYTRLLEAAELVESAEKLRKGARPDCTHTPKRQKRRNKLTSRPSRRKNTPVRPKRTRSRKRPATPVVGRKRKH